MTDWLISDGKWREIATLNWVFTIGLGTERFFVSIWNDLSGARNLLQIDDCKLKNEGLARKLRENDVTQQILATFLQNTLESK